MCQSIKHKCSHKFKIRFLEIPLHCYLYDYSINSTGNNDNEEILVKQVYLDNTVIGNNYFMYIFKNLKAQFTLSLYVLPWN